MCVKSQVMDPGVLAQGQAKLVRSPGGVPGGVLGLGGRGVSGGSLRLKERSQSMPNPPHSQHANPISGAGGGHRLGVGVVSPELPPHQGIGLAGQHQERASVSNDNNILLDPDILTDHVTQVASFSV